MTQHSSPYESNLDNIRNYGYSVARKVFSTDEINALQSAYQELAIGEKLRGFISTSTNSSVEDNLVASSKIGEVMGAKIASILSSKFSFFFGAFVVKAPNSENSNVPPHLDWTFVEEPEHISISAWVPLIPTNEENGRLGFKEKSHLGPKTIRGSAEDIRNISLYSDTFLDEFCNNLPSTYIDTELGDVILYDHRMVHFSLQNTLNIPRIAVNGVFIPQGCQAFHFHRCLDGSFRKYLIDASDFAAIRPGQKPEGKWVEPNHDELQVIKVQNKL